MFVEIFIISVDCYNVMDAIEWQLIEIIESELIMFLFIGNAYICGTSKQQPNIQTTNT